MSDRFYSCYHPDSMLKRKEKKKEKKENVEDERNFSWVQGDTDTDKCLLSSNRVAYTTVLII